jgi:hypothetical protein
MSSTGILRVPSPQYPTITAAVTAASPGAAILVAAGRYPETLTIATETLRVVAQGHVEVQSVVVQANNTLLDHLVVPGGISVTGAGCRVINCRVVGAPSVGISFSGILCLAYRNTVADCPTGISVSGKTHFVVDNRVVRCNEGIDVIDLGNHVMGNRIANCPTAGMVDRQGNNLFYRNTFRGHDGTMLGLQLQGAGESLVSDNVMQGARIQVESPSNLLVGNKLTCNKGAAIVITARRQVVTENRMRGNGSAITFHYKPDNYGHLVYRNILGPNDCARLPPRDVLRCSVFLQNRYGDCRLDRLEHEFARYNPGILRVPEQFPTLSAALAVAQPTQVVWVADGIYNEPPLTLATDEVRVLGRGKHVVIHTDQLTVQGSFVHFQGLSLVGTPLAVDKALSFRLLHNRLSKGSSVATSQSFSFTLYRNAIHGAPSDAVRITGMNSWLLGNCITQCAGSALVLAQPNTFGNALMDNRCSRNAASGIQDYAGSNFSQRNGCSDNGACGIQGVEGGEGGGNMLDNQVHRNGGYGIQVGTPLNWFHNNGVTGNTLGEYWLQGQWVY